MGLFENLSIYYRPFLLDAGMWKYNNGRAMDGSTNVLYANGILVIFIIIAIVLL